MDTFKTQFIGFITKLDKMRLETLHNKVEFEERAWASCGGLKAIPPLPQLNGIIVLIITFKIVSQCI